MKTSRQYGFTLIELLVVVLIIGVLSAIVLPQYQLAVARSHMRSIQPTVVALKQAEEAYYLYYGAYTQSIEDLDVTLSQCPKDAMWHDVAVCGQWMIDPVNGSAGSELAKNSVRASYCPNVTKGTKKWPDCETEGDYYITYWLSYSLHPDKIECHANTPLGQKMCQSMHT